MRALTFKVKLLTFPSIATGNIGLAATISGQNRLRFLASTGKFGTSSELRQACERANIPALLMGMPAPNIVYELTREQLATLGFNLPAAL